MAKKNTFWLSLLLMMVMVLSTACSDSEELKQPSSVQSDSSNTSTETSDSATEESTSGDSNASTEESTEDAAEDSTEDSQENTASAEVTLAETVIYDADNVKITATGYEEGLLGTEIQFLIENNTDKTLLITSSMTSVNGFMTSYSGLYAEVAAGKKANETMMFSSSDLDQYNIEAIADIQFYVEISDSETWETLNTSDLITLSTSASGIEQPVDDSGDVLYEENGIRIICKGLKQDIIWDGTLVFFIENTCGEPITVYAENVSVNGFMQDASFWADLRDNTRIIDGLSMWDLSDLELESIDDIENIEFNLRIINADNWDEIATTDVISLSFE